MNRLITIEEIQAVKPLTKQAGNNNERFFLSIIEDMQQMDLRPRLGDKLFIRVLNDPTSYTDLLNGSTFDDGNRIHFGLKRVAIEFFWERYLFQSGEVSTPFGVVKKNFEDGQPIPRPREKELKTKGAQQAQTFWYDVKSFILQEETLSELYNGSDRNSSTYKSTTINRRQCL